MRYTRRRARSLPRSRRRVLGCEALEHRWLLAITVDTLVDEADGSVVDGDVSLRDAIGVAPAGETIDFDVSLDGGTILLTLGELAITDSLTVDATALADGLTIDSSGNDPTPDENRGDGSRVFNIDDGDDSTDSQVVIRGLTLTGGDVGGEGGAISTRETLTVTSSTISENSAPNGGGIYAGGAVTVTSSTISANSASREAFFSTNGGGILASGDVTVTSSTISKNWAWAGGGIAASGAVTVTSSTISGNGAWTGGGIAASGAVTVTSSTISRNSARGIGGIWADGDVAVTIDDSIVAGNTRFVGGTASDVDPGSGPFSVRHSLIGDNTGTGLPEAPVGMPDADGNLIGGPINGIIDPMLASLADNGGPTQTHALLVESPAIDAGDPDFTPPPDFDQRGDPLARIFGERIDMGAYERQTGDMDVDGDIDFDDIDSFVFGIAFPLDYEQQYAVPPNANGDTDGDGDLDFDDIPGFVELLGAEPSTAATTQTTAPSRAVGILFVQTGSETDEVEIMAPTTQPGESKPPNLDMRRLSRRAIKQLDELGGGSSGMGGDEVRDTDEAVWTGDTDWLR